MSANTIISTLKIYPRLENILLPPLHHPDKPPYQWFSCSWFFQPFYSQCSSQSDPIKQRLDRSSKELVYIWIVFHLFIKIKYWSILPCSLIEYVPIKVGHFGSVLPINHMKIFFKDRMKTAPHLLYILNVLKNDVIFQFIHYMFLVPIFARFYTLK